MKDPKDIIKTLLFYAEKLQSEKETKEFQQEHQSMGLTYDYYHRALQETREFLGGRKNLH